MNKKTHTQIRILLVPVLCICMCTGCFGKEKQKEKSFYDEWEEPYQSYGKQVEGLMNGYMRSYEELPYIFYETSGTQMDDKKCCFFFGGQSLNGLQDIWNEDTMWISKLSVRPFFHAWIEDGGVKTDYPAWLLSSTLYITMEQGIYDGKWEYCLDADMPSYSGYAFPYYPLLEEPLVLYSEASERKIEPVFKAVYEQMHEIQLAIDEDLSCDIRFEVRFDVWNDYARRLPEEDFSTTEEWMDTMAIRAYNRWKKERARYFPVHRISFFLPYEEGGKAVFEALMEDRSRYYAVLEEEKKNDKKNDREHDEENNSQVYFVKAGDSLWRIAKKVYGSGTLWYELYERNRDVIGEDPDLLYVGTELTI